MREMKDSGIEWIGEIPKDWSIVAVKHCFNISNGSDPITDEGEIPVYGSGSKSFKTCKEFKEGPTVLLGRKGTINIPQWIENKYWNVDTAFDVQPKENYDLKLFYYCAVCFDYERYTTQTALPSMTQGDYKNFKIPYMSFYEQQQIANFLDTQCSEIDATAEDIQKEISLLEDYKKSVITEAVTKGLNPDAEMKDSGIEWIGEIPKDWKVIKTKYVADISIGLVTTMTANYVDNLDDGVYLIRNGDIRLNKISKEKMVYISRKFVEQNASRQLLENDIVTVHTGYIGTSAIIRDDFIGSVGFATIQSRPNLNIINERYLCWFYNSSFFIKQCMLHNTGDGRQNLNLYDFVNFYVYQPPLAEQQQIADYLDSKCSEIDTLIADKKRQLDILAEYKKSLIYEYVTGKKEVPVNE